MEHIKLNIRKEIPEGYEIDLEESDLKTGNIVLKKSKPKYPQSIEKINDRFTFVLHTTDHFNLNFVSSSERVAAFRALIQLVELRDAWNKVDGFEVDWRDGEQRKFCVNYYDNEIDVCSFTSTHSVLYFGSPDTRDLFLKTFRDLIEEAKELI